jgi:hypothetical protein
MKAWLYAVLAVALCVVSAEGARVAAAAEAPAAKDSLALRESVWQVDSVALPTRVSLREVVVTGPGVPPLASLDDLSGKRIHVRSSTSWAESLGALNERLRAAGPTPAELVPLPDAL